MKRRAVFVGVAAYQDREIQDLQYAIDDAEKMRGIFDRLGFQTTLLRNEHQVKVLNTIENVTSDLHTGDMFLLFFSGHGFSVGGEDLVFCPEDRCRDLRCGNSAGLSHAKIKTRTERAGDQFDRVFLFDTCRSFLAGAKGVTDEIVRTDGSRIGTKDLSPSGTFTRNVTGSVYFLRSCSSGEQSLELPNEGNEENGNGLFTMALLSVLEQSYEARRPIDLDGEFYRALCEKMEQIKGARACDCIQTPESSIAGRMPCLWRPDETAVPPPLPKRHPPSVTPPPVTPSPQQTDPLVESMLDEAIKQMQFLCGSATVDLSQNRNDAEMRERLDAVRMVFYKLDRANRRGKRRTARYGTSELDAMARACSEMNAFLQRRFEEGRTAFLAREYRSSILVKAQELRGTPYAKLAELMLKCVSDPEER